MPALRDALAAHPEVISAWLFGSRARGTARPGSDVDVAVLIGHRPAGFDDYPWEIEATLEAALHLRVQVVVADVAPADLIRRVLRDGILLVDRDRSRRLAFEVRKRNEYFDMTRIWRQVRRLPAGVDP